MIINVKTPIPSRLDKYLRRLYPLLTQGVIEKALRNKQITVNLHKAEAGLRVVEGAEIFISDKFNLPEQQLSKLVFTDAEITLAKKITGDYTEDTSRVGNQISGEPAERTIVREHRRIPKFDVPNLEVSKGYLVYEDDNIIAINKPAGLATQGGSKINLSVDAALKYLNSKAIEYTADTSKVGNQISGESAERIPKFDVPNLEVSKIYKLVHRLDKETSGLLLIAKNYVSSVKLHDAFKEKLVAKTYLAVTYGKPVENTGEVRSKIEKSKNGVCAITDINDENGKLAITYYKLLKSLGNNLFLIEFNPITGKMHQLRLHAKLLGCPIVGDNKYGNKELMPHHKYMFLHASSIVLSKKVFGKEISLNAKLPLYFSNKF